MTREKLLELLNQNEDTFHKLVAQASYHQGAMDTLKLLIAEFDEPAGEKEGEKSPSPVAEEVKE